LPVCLRKKRFLVFLASEGEQCSPPIIARETFPSDFRFAVCEDGYSSLVLVQFVALVFEV
jgi:hypothetical protein